MEECGGSVLDPDDLLEEVLDAMLFLYAFSICFFYMRFLYAFSICVCSMLASGKGTE